MTKLPDLVFGSLSGLFVRGSITVVVTATSGGPAFMTISTIKMTARQFVQLGEDPVGVRLELVDGEVAVSPSPEPKHSYTDRKLTFVLVGHVEANHLGAVFGDVDTLFGEFDVRRPDIIYFARSRLHLIGNKAMEGPPDLCVEIVSPSSVNIDRKEKLKQYAKGKVAHYWIVDPTRRSFEAHQLVGRKYRKVAEGTDDDVVRAPPFPTLKIALSDLWWKDGRKG